MHVRLFLIVVISSTLAPATRAVDVYVSAAAGQPYGVVSIEIPVDPPVVGRVLPPITATNPDGRVLYPIADDMRTKVLPVSESPVPQPGRGRLLGRVGNLIRELTAGNGEDLEQTVARRVMFLVHGDQPVRVSLGDAGGEIGQYEIAADGDAALQNELLGQWWSSYTAAARRQIDAAKYPPLVQTYLVGMLSGRLGLPLPDWYLGSSENNDELLGTLQLIGGASKTSQSIFSLAAAGGSASTLDTTAVLPAPPNWSPSFASPDLNNIAVEPIATRVPAECFYVRYGSFENYLWFRDLSQQFGGDISRMISVRGTNDNTTARIEDQLNLKTTELTRMLGSTVIDDQAIIGRDAFMTEGATVGVLFKTKNAFLMRTSLSSDRSKLASSDPAVTLKDVKVADRPISLLSTADNRIRSFLVEDDGYILVTNSKTLVERFLEVGQSGESLATSSAFRLSRQLMPVDRNDSIFAYFSPEMLQGLVAPKYLIELRRRLFAKSDIALVHLARLAAAAEGRAITGIDELASAGFLPTGFGQRVDGSGVISVGDQIVDTLRGARGTFLPIADVEIESVTAEEAAWYRRIAQGYSDRFPEMDPIMVGVGRSKVDPQTGIERINLHAEIAPWQAEKYGWVAQQLGPPTQVALEFAPDDIAALQAHVASPQLGPPTHLFAAIKDSVPPEPEDFDGILNIYRSLRQIPGYLGAWPQPGALDRLPLGLGRGQPVGPGMSRLIGGLYRYTGGGFSILSFQPDVMQASLPFLSAVDVADHAQVRMQIGNLNGSQIENWVNGQLYDLSSEGSGAGANFLGQLSRQLSVDPSQVGSASEKILGAEVQCTLGGEYQYDPEVARWSSTAWQGDVLPTIAPPGYMTPALEWFRGTNATVTQFDDRLIADAVIDIQRK
jgi:hypothetical protein